MHLGIGASTKQIILSTVMVFIGISKRGIRERQNSCDTREFVKLKSTNGKTNSKNNTLVEMARVFFLYWSALPAGRMPISIKVKRVSKK